MPRHLQPAEISEEIERLDVSHSLGDRGNESTQSSADMTGLHVRLDKLSADVLVSAILIPTLALTTVLLKFIAIACAAEAYSYSMCSRRRSPSLSSLFIFVCFISCWFF